VDTLYKSIKKDNCENNYSNGQQVDRRPLMEEEDQLKVERNGALTYYQSSKHSKASN